MSMNVSATPTTPYKRKAEGELAQEPKRSKPTPVPTMGLFIHSETSGLNPNQHVVLEVALQLFSLLGGEKRGGYRSFLKLDQATFRAIDRKALNVNGITWDHIDQKGRTVEEVAAVVRALFARLNVTTTTTKIICHNKEFEMPFFEKILPESRHFDVIDLRNLYLSKVGRGEIPGVTLQTAFRSGRNDIATKLNLQKVAVPHSARSVVCHLVSLYSKLNPTFFPENGRPHHFDVSVYKGTTRQRELFYLTPISPNHSRDYIRLPGENPNIVKGSDAWKAWVKEGIDCSEIKYIENMIPIWKTPYQLWQEKTGKIEPPPLTAAQSAARALLPSARAAFTAATGLPIRPACIDDPETSFFKCTLDGVTQDGKTIVTILCPGEKSYNQAQAGSLPPMILYGVQAALMCCLTAECAFVWVYDPVKPGILIKVLPDKAMQNEIEKSLYAFMAFIDTDKAPPKVAADRRREQFSPSS